MGLGLGLDLELGLGLGLRLGVVILQVVMPKLVAPPRNETALLTPCERIPYYVVFIPQSTTPYHYAHQCSQYKKKKTGLTCIQRRADVNMTTAGMAMLWCLSSTAYGGRGVSGDGRGAAGGRVIRRDQIRPAKAFVLYLSNTSKTSWGSEVTYSLQGHPVSH